MWLRLPQHVEDEFVTLIGCNVSHIAKATTSAKDVRPDDETFHLVLSRNIGRCGAVQQLLELETGKVRQVVSQPLICVS